MKRASLLALLWFSVGATAAGLNDPTLPTPILSSGSASVATSGLILNATYVSDQQRYAIINGVRLKEGQSYRNLVLKNIRHNRVTLIAYGKLFDLKINKTIVKSP